MIDFILFFTHYYWYDPTPSMEYINVTKRLVEAGKLLGIEVLNHLVVNNDNSFTSLKERGYI